MWLDRWIKGCCRHAALAPDRPEAALGVAVYCCSEIRPAAGVAADATTAFGTSTEAIKAPSVSTVQVSTASALSFAGSTYTQRAITRGEVPAS